VDSLTKPLHPSHKHWPRRQLKQHIVLSLCCLLAADLLLLLFLLLLLVLHPCTRKDFWWGMVAVRLAGLKEISPPPPHRLLRPELSCPNYTEHWVWEYPFAEAISVDQARDRCSRALYALLLAEVWWLWPWQLQVLEAGGAKAAAAGRAAVVAAKAAALPAPGTGSGSEGGNKGGASTSLPPPAAAAAASPVSETAPVTGAVEPATAVVPGGMQDSADGGRSSSDSGRTMQSKGSSKPPTGGIDWRSRKWAFEVPFYLTPQVGDLGTGFAPPQVPLPPVTRQQLQLVVDLIVHGGGHVGYQAGVLLVLLLARADPGLRAAFLNGPEASLLLTMLLCMAATPQRADAPGGISCILYQTLCHSWPGVWTDVFVAWSGAGMLHCITVPPASSSLLLIAMCYLQPQLAAPGDQGTEQVPVAVAGKGSPPRTISASCGLGEYCGQLFIQRMVQATAVFAFCCLAMIYASCLLRASLSPLTCCPSCPWLHACHAFSPQQQLTCPSAFLLCVAACSEHAGGTSDAPTHAASDGRHSHPTPVGHH
jgi:hypothetical protein